MSLTRKNKLTPLSPGYIQNVHARLEKLGFTRKSPTLPILSRSYTRVSTRSRTKRRTPTKPKNQIINPYRRRYINAKTK